MSDKLKIMSLSVEAEMQTQLKNTAKKLGCSVSSMVRELVNKHLDLIANDEDEIPVILKVPADLKGNEEELREWLNVKVDALVKALG